MFLQLMSFERNLFNTLHRLLKFLCWFPVSFVARLLGSNTWLFTLSQETEVFETRSNTYNHLPSSDEKSLLSQSRGAVKESVEYNT